MHHQEKARKIVASREWRQDPTLEERHGGRQEALQHPELEGAAAPAVAAADAGQVGLQGARQPHCVRHPPAEAHRPLPLSLPASSPDFPSLPGGLCYDARCPTKLLALGPRTDGSCMGLPPTQPVGVRIGL